MTLTPSGKWADKIEEMLAPYANEPTRCYHCNKPMEKKSNRTAFFCSSNCRQLDYLQRKKDRSAK